MNFGLFDCTHRQDSCSHDYFHMNVVENYKVAVSLVSPIGCPLSSLFMSKVRHVTRTLHVYVIMTEQ